MPMKLDYAALIAYKQKSSETMNKLYVHQWWEQAFMFCQLSALLSATVASSLMSRTKYRAAAASFVNPLNFLPNHFQENSIHYQDIVVLSASFLLLLPPRSFSLTMTEFRNACLTSWKEGASPNRLTLIKCVKNITWECAVLKYSCPIAMMMGGGFLQLQPENSVLSFVVIHKKMPCILVGLLLWLLMSGSQNA